MISRGSNTPGSYRDSRLRYSLARGRAEKRCAPHGRRSILPGLVDTDAKAFKPGGRCQMSMTRRIFPEAFKRDAVDRAASNGLSVEKVVTELGLHETVLRRLVKPVLGPGDGTAERPMTQMPFVRSCLPRSVPMRRLTGISLRFNSNGYGRSTRAARTPRARRSLSSWRCSAARLRRRRFSKRFVLRVFVTERVWIPAPGKTGLDGCE